MSIKTKINSYRRSITQKMTSGIGKNNLNSISKNKADVKQILIVRTNHRLGNQLLITPLIEELISEFSNAKIDIFVQGKVAQFIHERNTAIDRIIELPRKPFKALGTYLSVWFSLRKKQYDLVINVIPSSSSGRIATMVSKGQIKLFGDEYQAEIDALTDGMHMAKIALYNHRFFSQSIQPKEYKAIGPLYMRLDTQELTNAQNILNSLQVNKDKPVIGLFTYATGAKCYLKSQWINLHQDLVKQFPNYEFIEILPVENISAFDHQITSYYSKDIREIASVMHHCAAVLAADSGMMHLSVAANTPTLGLFKFDNIERYKPYGNNNCGVLSEELQPEAIVSALKEILV